MDLKKFYQKLREIEQKIPDVFPVIVTHETPDGGCPGQKVEVPRSIAARMVVEGRAHVANAEEATAYREAVDQARQEAEQRALAEKVQVNVISESDLRTIKSTPRVDKR